MVRSIFLFSLNSLSVFYFIHVEGLVNIGEHRPFLAFGLDLLLGGDHKVSSFYRFEHPFGLLSIGTEHFHLFPDEVDILLWHLERLSEARRPHFQFEVFLVAVEMVFDKLAQLHAVFYPHAVGVVNLHNNLVVLADLNVNEEIVFSLEPCLH